MPLNNEPRRGGYVGGNRGPLGHWDRQMRELREESRKQEQRQRIGFAVWGCLCVLVSLGIIGVVVWAIIRLVLTYT